MRFIKYIKAGLCASLFMAVVGCNDYLDINNNPNQVTTATPQLALPSALATTGWYLSGNVPPGSGTTANTNFYFLNLWMGYWNWSGNYSIATSDKNYQFTQGFNNSIWSSAYLNLSNYNYIENQATTLNQPILRGMAKIMKALHFHILVDTYGDVPYRSALQGTTNILPSYESGQVIYEDLFKQIDSAMVFLNNSEGTLNPGANDIMFGGDVSKWLKFGNTLKLRMLLRQSEKPERAQFIQSQLAIINASGYGFLGPRENASVNPGYSNSQNQQNPLYGAFYAINGNPTTLNNQYKGNLYGITFYQQTNDPRLNAYYRPVAGTTSQFNGTYFGTTDPLVNSQVSDIGPGVLQNVSQSSPVLQSHESLFMQSEAAQRGWIQGDPKALYQSAITESFLNVGRTAAEAATYYAQPGVADVNWEASPNKLEAIITQKWASENGTAPFEAWSDYRRLGLPATIPISQDPSTTVRQIPVRLLYPTSEYSNNATNVAAQGTINQFTSKIFWMK
ncbi:SusD/RagB family nutrient-binding outer membrane lipoprotein [Spirosoma oryzicola]|uniref:SusD/RagB family nutrient-binding outer membrane lipoprotein n=1 Tax=Spirosoma oryzicola TaxID=2898794 RepID=UPI001E3AD7EF|nr:SusD/RagB family nutrient-binding outer membrane lipoprotein [Spirosoma oryzicola]UHG94166.1 SusD/RagB family nutrient-binding outer membrane lipoprotein [Spirosoma oryzicola]